MDQEETYAEENQIPEQEYNQEYESVTVAPPLEGAFSKYMREYRLLNSLLISLFMMTILMASIWGMMMGIALSGEGSSDFSDGGGGTRCTKTGKTKSG
ncbi:hypothetical protein OAO16_02530 [Opitutales bacterium]|nr:hypothetical protein [Opitutales bacterium]